LLEHLAFFPSEKKKKERKTGYHVVKKRWKKQIIVRKEFNICHRRKHITVLEI